MNSMVVILGDYTGNIGIWLNYRCKDDLFYIYFLGEPVVIFKLISRVSFRKHGGWWWR